jgi:hypothetical protein
LSVVCCPFSVCCLLIVVCCLPSAVSQTITYDSNRLDRVVAYESDLGCQDKGDLVSIHYNLLPVTTFYFLLVYFTVVKKQAIL